MSTNTRYTNTIYGDSVSIKYSEGGREYIGDVYPCESCKMMKPPHWPCWHCEAVKEAEQRGAANARKAALDEIKKQMQANVIMWAGEMRGTLESNLGFRAQKLWAIARAVLAPAGEEPKQ